MKGLSAVDGRTRRYRARDESIIGNERTLENLRFPRGNLRVPANVRFAPVCAPKVSRGGGFGCRSRTFQVRASTRSLLRVSIINTVRGKERERERGLQRTCSIRQGLSLKNDEKATSRRKLLLSPGCVFRSSSQGKSVAIFLPPTVLV